MQLLVYTFLMFVITSLYEFLLFMGALMLSYLGAWRSLWSGPGYKLIYTTVTSDSLRQKLPRHLFIQLGSRIAML
jgi:hypothetical protein